VGGDVIHDLLLVVRPADAHLLMNPTAGAVGTQQQGNFRLGMHNASLVGMLKMPSRITHRAPCHHC
jgi:hypothetical protein